MKYYAVNNTYSTESSLGFTNTWFVLVFDSKTARDEYVANSPRLAARAIKRTEIGEYIEAPKPFSGKCWRVFCDSACDTKGLVGEIIIDWSDGGLGERFN